MKKILIPTDFSENAFNALQYAVQLYWDDECIFYLMHTYTPPVYQSEYLLHSPSQLGLGDVYRTESLANLEKVQERIQKLFKNSKHHFLAHSAFNLLIDEILETVEKEQVDVIIMGTQGATGAEEILFGSHTVQVIKKVKCPIIAIPSNFAFAAPKEILFPTDYEIAYQKGQLNELAHLAKNHKAHINVLHVCASYELRQEQKENKAGLEKILSGNILTYHDVPDTEIITAINDVQVKQRTQLLVMIRNKHTFFERLFIEPIIKRIAFHIKVPFMVIPNLADF